MSRDTNEIMGHAADNDGIEEYDNPLPDWWIGLFVVTIIGGIAYGIDYHFVSHRSQADSYVAEMAAADLVWPASDGPTLAALTPENLASGADVYKANCAACHLADLSGKIGPNLKDDTWIHGGTQEEIQATVTNGVPAKGMITWGPILGPEKIGLVSAYVYSEGPKLGLHPSP